MAEGRVIVNQRRQFLVEDNNGDRVRCIVKGRKLLPVAGDRVQWVALDDDVGLIQHIHDRRNTLCRYDVRRGKQPLAANLDQLLVVTASQPALDIFMLDKYLVAAAASGIEAIIVFNKIDLLDSVSSEETNKLLAEYATLGHQTIQVSVQSNTGLEEFSRLLTNKLSALIGASGVGKSSLVNWLLPDAAVRIADLSTARDEGRHTTTSSQLYPLPFGGDLVDSPGVRDFMLWPMPVAELKDYFIEFQGVAEHCKYSDCTHVAEPDCAVQKAVQEGRLLTRRHDSYRGMVRIMQAQYEAKQL